MKKFSRVLCLLSLTGCSTVAEVLLESGSSADYTSATDSNGHTKFVRERIVSSNDHYLRPSPIYEAPDKPISPAFSLLDLAASSLPSRTENVSTDEDSTDSIPDTSIVASVSANKDTANGDFSFEWMDDYVSGGVGIAFVESDRSYFGFNGGIRAHFPWRVTPFAGVGFYGGDSKTCTYEDLGYGYKAETCEKYFLMALTADLGVQVSFNDHVRTRLFARGFSQTRQGDPLGATLYGMSLAVLF